MLSWIPNVFTGKLDAIRSLAQLDGRYVNVTGDTMTGDLNFEVAADQKINIGVLEAGGYTGLLCFQHRLGLFI